MNILILANQDLASNMALNMLLPRLQEHRLSVFLSSKVGKPGTSPELKRLGFFEQSLCNELVFPHLSPPEQRPGKYRSFSQLTPFLTAAAEVLNDINSDQGLCRVGELKPDLILSIRYGGILKDALISIPKQGVINLHSGLLPDYRGVMATFWAMLNGATEIGTTCHFIEDGSIDTGGIIATSALAVQPDRSYLWHVLQLYPAGCELLINAVQSIEQGQAPRSEPQPGGGQYFSFPTQEHLATFTQRGFTLIDEEEVLAFLKQHYY